MHVVRTSQQVLIAPVGNLLQKPFAWLSLRACSLNQQTFKVKSIQVSKRRFEQSVTHLFDLFRDGFKKGFVFKRVWVHWKKLRFYLMTKSPNFQVRGIQMSEKQMEKISWNFPSVDTSFWSTPIQIGNSRSQQVYASRTSFSRSAIHLELLWSLKAT